ncbi:hypothetical protein HAX54_000132, partial [Datura stramonium]|nr:hypothetical protein [Datura stramonium]
GGEKGERGREVGSGGCLVGLGGFAEDGEEKEETTTVGVVYDGKRNEREKWSYVWFGAYSAARLVVFR